jgi:hypothetical protein
MAYRVSAQTGNFSTASTWNQVTNTPTIHASTSITVTNSNKYTATFTAPNTTNACTGVLVLCTTVPTQDWTVTLQENSIDTAATATIAVADIPVSSSSTSWVYFRFSAPYVFTSTTAGYYRFKLRTASSATGQAAADSGGSLFAFLAVDDRQSVPATTENVWVQAPNNTGTLTVTMDGTQSIGDGADTSLMVAAQRSLGLALTVGKGGVVSWDSTASATLTVKGSVINLVGGEFAMGTVATPIPAAYTARLLFNQNGTTTNYGIRNNAGGRMILQGAPKSSTSLWKTKYVSGVGTAASPLVTSTAVDWSVGDEIMITPGTDSATNYNETENKFIITKNSSTSYVLSNTSGGAEAAFTYTHSTDSHILNVQRNVLIDTSNTAHAFYLANASTVAGDFDVDWTRFETVGSSTTSKTGIIFSGAVNVKVQCDYSVAYRPLYYGFVWSNSKEPSTHTGLIGCLQNSGTNTTGAFALFTQPNNKTFTDCFAIKNNRMGWYLSGIYNATFTRCYAISGATALTTNGGGFYIPNSGALTFTDCESEANRSFGIYASGFSNVRFVNSSIGSKCTNLTDIQVVADTFNQGVFDTCTFGNASPVVNYLNSIPGTLLQFNNTNGTQYNNTWYTYTGYAVATGAGLTDTTTRTSGSYAVRLTPEENVDGMSWSFKILAKANSAVYCLGFLQKNATFGTSVAKVELYLPGSSTADATYTMSNTTGVWEVFSVSASYTGSVDDYATVKITGITATAGAYLYIADIFNGTNAITGMRVWDDGMPSPIMFEQLGDAAAVWAVPTSALTVSGSVGELVVATEKKVDDNTALIIGM